MRPQSSFARLVAPCLLAAATASCLGSPTIESIRYGYKPPQVEAQVEKPMADDYNDMASGWAPERPSGQRPVNYGFDGTPVGATRPGTVTQTEKPLNSGVTPASGGSRDTILELYTSAAEKVLVLTTRNEDLQMGMDQAESRAYDLDQQLKGLQVSYDSLGKEKQAVEARNVDLAGRLATAQIARLEAERALLEATLEWRRISASNNEPLTGTDGRGKQP